MKNEFTYEDYKRRVSERLRQARSEVGMSRKEVYQKLDLDHRELSDWENGHRLSSLAMLVKLAEFYGVPTGWLFQREDVVPYWQKEPYDHFRTKTCIGKYVAYLRDGRGLSVDDLCFMANMNPHTYYNLTKGRRFTIKTFLRVCNAMNVLGDDILAKCVTYDFAGGYNPETGKMEGWWPGNA